jgi:hypothetical protein
VKDEGMGGREKFIVVNIGWFLLVNTTEPVSTEHCLVEDKR